MEEGLIFAPLQIDGWDLGWDQGRYTLKNWYGGTKVDGGVGWYVMSSFYYHVYFDFYFYSNFEYFAINP